MVKRKYLFLRDYNIIRGFNSVSMEHKRLLTLNLHGINKLLFFFLILTKQNISYLCKTKGNNNIIIYTIMKNFNQIQDQQQPDQDPDYGMANCVR